MITFVGMSSRSSGNVRGLQVAQALGGNFFDTDKGMWDIPPESRLQLPAIAREIVPTRSFKGYQLGGGQRVYTDVLFHCIAEDEITRNKLVDVISLQNDKNIYLFDSNKINDSGVFPLDYRGTPIPSALRYPDLLDTFNGVTFVCNRNKIGV